MFGEGKEHRASLWVRSAVADYCCDGDDGDDDDGEMLFESWETGIGFDNLELPAGFIACKYSPCWILALPA